MDVLEIKHSPSAGDLLLWDSNVSGNAGGQSKKVVKVSEFLFLNGQRTPTS